MKNPCLSKLTTLCGLLAVQAATATTLTFQDGVNGYYGTRDESLRAGFPDSPHQFHVIYMDTPDWNSPDPTQYGFQALLKFTSIFGDGVGQIPYGSAITSATLTLYTPATDQAPGFGGTFHRMLVPWEETSTWNSLGNGIQADGTEAASTISCAAGTSRSYLGAGFRSFDATADVAAWSAGAPIEGWAGLTWGTGLDGWGFASREWETPSQRPLLATEFQPIPEPSSMVLMLAGAGAALLARSKRVNACS